MAEPLPEQLALFAASDLPVPDDEETRGPVSRGMRSLLRECAEEHPERPWHEIMGIDYDAGVETLGKWLRDLLTTEPPPTRVNALFFGLVTSGEGARTWEQVYVVGTPDYHLERDDWAFLYERLYLPERRFAPRELLEGLSTWFRSQEEGDETSDAAGCEDRMYLGYLSLTLAAVLKSLDPAVLLGKARQRAVGYGFAGGGQVLLGTVAEDGWRPGSEEFRFAADGKS